MIGGDVLRDHALEEDGLEEYLLDNTMGEELSPPPLAAAPLLTCCAAGGRRRGADSTSRPECA